MDFNVIWLSALIAIGIHADSMEDFFNDDLETTTSLNALKNELHQHCSNFLDCESEMMNIHQKCTSASRQATGEACGLIDDFRHLNTLMETRVNEFAACVSNDTNTILNDSFFVETLDLPFAECDSADPSVMLDVMHKEGCWKALSQVKQRCKVLQKCCPAAKTCTKKGRNTEATLNVRQKHIEINRRTLECRNSMREVLEKRNRGENVSLIMLARAHAVLTSESASAIDGIQKKYVYNKAERHQQKMTEEIVPLKQNQKQRKRVGILGRNDVIRRIMKNQHNNGTKKRIIKTGSIFLPPLTTKKMNVVAGDATVTPMPSLTIKPIGRMNDVKLQPETLIPMLKTTRMPLTTIKMTRVSSAMAQRDPLTPLEQLKAFEKMLGEVYGPTRRHNAPISTTARPKVKQPIRGIKNYEPHEAATGIFPAEPKTHSPTQLSQMQTMFQPQAFALPSTFNMTKMHVFDGRPKLQKMSGDPTEGRMMPPRPTTTTTAPITPRSRVHAIKTATINQFPLKQVELTRSKDADKAVGDAYVNADGAWTVDPAPLEYPDYGQQFDGKGTTVNIEEIVSTTVRPIVSTVARAHAAGKKTTPPLKVLDHTLSSLFEAVDTQDDFLGHMDRTTVPSDVLSVRTTIPETTSATSTTSTTSPLIQKNRSPKAMKLSRKDEAEMILVKKDLVKNLEMFVVKHTHEAALKKEDERLDMLRRSRQDTKAGDMTYCKLYSICSEQLKFVQKECEDSGGRLVPGLPKRRFGDCNKKLVTQYKRVDKMRKRLEKSLEECLSDRINVNDAPTLRTCPSDWPILPLFEEQTTCDQRKRFLQNHCTKLGRCCGATQDCRAILDGSKFAQKLVHKQEILAEASAKCQIRAYNDYKKYQTTKPSTSKRPKLHNVKNIVPQIPVEPPKLVHPTKKPTPMTVTPSRRNQTPATHAQFLQPLIFGDLNRQRISIPMNGDDLQLYTHKERRRQH